MGFWLSPYVRPKTSSITDDPENVDVLHFLGVLKRQQGENVQAIKLLRTFGSGGVFAAAAILVLLLGEEWTRSFDRFPLSRHALAATCFSACSTVESLT